MVWFDALTSVIWRAYVGCWSRQRRTDRAKHLAWRGGERHRRTLMARLFHVEHWTLASKQMTGAYGLPMRKSASPAAERTSASESLRALFRAGTAETACLPKCPRT